MINFFFKSSFFDKFYFFNIRKSIINIFKDGYYLDSLVKRFLENIIKKLFIYSGIFFGEKYIMEQFGPKLVENVIWSFKNKFFFEHISISLIFYNVIFLFFLINFYFSVFYFFVFVI